MRVGVLVKQVPVADALTLGPDGRLVRSGVGLETNPYCRRAMAQAAALAAASGGSWVAVSQGPPSAEEVLAEALACGAEQAVLLSDPGFAGADTLATSAALAAAVERLGPFDLILVGRSAVDADTGQVGPQVAERLGWAFVPAARALWFDAPTGPGPGRLRARCELDDGWQEVQVPLPAVVAAAERLIDPCKPAPEAVAQVDRSRIRRLGPADLGPGPFGSGGSRTVVRGVRQSTRPARERLVVGPEDLDLALAALRRRLRAGPNPEGPSPEELNSEGTNLEGAPVPVGDRRGPDGRWPGSSTGTLGPVVVLAEPGRPELVRALVAEGERLGDGRGGSVALAGAASEELLGLASSSGVELVLAVQGRGDPAALAGSLAAFWTVPGSSVPPIILAPGTQWGRELASRLAVRLGAGLTGDAVALRLEGDRLVCAKPEPAGMAMAEVVALGPVQMATLRPGRAGRVGGTDGRAGSARIVAVPEAPGAAPAPEVLGGGREDDVAALLAARRVLCLGLGVQPPDYPLAKELAARLGAELAGTRKVTDRGWLPRARQVGITGHSLAPELYVAVGVSGRTNHAVGVLQAGTVLAVNSDPGAAVFGWADVGVVGDWRQVLPTLVDGLSDASAASISERGTPSR